MTRHRLDQSLARRGKAALVWVVAVLTLGLGGLFWSLASDGVRPPAPPRALTSSPSADPSPAQATLERAAAPQSAVPTAPVDPPPPAAVEEPRTGRLKIEVLDSAGAALPELPVYLANTNAPAFEIATDFSGLADFAAVPSGEWRVRLGGPQHPLVPQIALQVPESEIVEKRVTVEVALVEVDVELLDDAGRPAPNVAVRARCEKGGEPRATTDSAGRATLRYVQPGPVRFFANDELLGRGNRIVELEPGVRATVQFALRRKS